MNSTAYTTRSQSTDTTEYQPQAFESSKPVLNDSSHVLGGHGFAQKFGLHPGIALLTLVVDSMLMGGEIGSMGLLIPVSIASAVVLGIITFMAQRKWYGDDAESAFIKALTLAFLTAIPTALPAFLYLPAGVVGLFRRKE